MCAVMVSGDEAGGRETEERLEQRGLSESGSNSALNYSKTKSIKGNKDPQN